GGVAGGAGGGLLGLPPPARCDWCSTWAAGASLQRPTGARRGPLLAGATCTLVFATQLRDQLSRLAVGQLRFGLWLAQRRAQLADADELLLSRGLIGYRAWNAAHGCACRSRRSLGRCLRTGLGTRLASRALGLDWRVDNAITLIHLGRKGGAIAKRQQGASQRLGAGLLGIITEVSDR